MYIKSELFISGLRDLSLESDILKPGATIVSIDGKLIDKSYEINDSWDYTVITI